VRPYRNTGKGPTMTHDERQYCRRSLRLKGYDYTQSGAYSIVTIVTQDRECLFGEVVSGTMRLNDLGRIVWEEWFRSAEIRREIHLTPEEFVVMPNHIHGIVWIGDHAQSPGAHDNTPCVGAHGRAPLRCASLRFPTPREAAVDSRRGMGTSRPDTTAHCGVRRDRGEDKDSEAA
jgi:hypothetical protein